MAVEHIKRYGIAEGLNSRTAEPLASAADTAIAELSSAVQKAGNFRRVTLTMHPFVPKPHTAFQWAGSPPPPEMERRLKLAGKAVRPGKQDPARARSNTRA